MPRKPVSVPGTWRHGESLCSCPLAFPRQSPREVRERPCTRLPWRLFASVTPRFPHTRGFPIHENTCPTHHCPAACMCCLSLLIPCPARPLDAIAAPILPRHTLFVSRVSRQASVWRRHRWPLSRAYTMTPASDTRGVTPCLPDAGRLRTWCGGRPRIRICVLYEVKQLFQLRDSNSVGRLQNNP